jgi:Phosphotransferase enzyme family
VGVNVGFTHSVETSPIVAGRLVDRGDLVAQERLTYLRQVCELLWPPPAVVTMDDGRSQLSAIGIPRHRAHGPQRAGVSNFGLVPGLRRPPLLVPAEQHVAAAAIHHFSGQRSRAARMTTKMFSLVLASGFGDAVLRGRVQVDAPAAAETIETYLAAVLGRDIMVSMYLGPPRANRKPVLQLLTPEGEPVAFAKVGINPLTCRLVRAERDALARLDQAGLADISLPRVLHRDQWHGLEVLVLSAVPAWTRRRPLSPARLAVAMNAVARVDGLHSVPLRGSVYLRRLRDRLASADKGPEQAALMRALDTLTTRSGRTVLTYGAWHGDWAPWNMASTKRGLLLWDWERFTPGVPLGFDALHYRLQADLGPGHRDPLTAAAATSQSAAQLLAPFGIGAEQAWLTGVLYLTELATRYLVDRQASAGAQNGAPGTWLIPAITTEASRP